MTTTNRNFTAASRTGHGHAHARSAHTPHTPHSAGLFLQWQHAEAQASAARRRVRLGCVADGSEISDTDVCDALLKERRAGDLAAQLLQRFGSGRVARAQSARA